MKKNLAKKSLSLLLCLLMVTALLAGCGGSGEKKDSDSSKSGNSAQSAGDGEVQDVALKVWVPEEEMEITQKMLDAFDKAHPEYNCTFDLAVIGIDEASSALENDPELAADVFQLPSGSISQLNDAGLLLPIVANIDEVKSLYSEGAIEAVSREDESMGELMYGVPFTFNSWFMYYNKDMYSEDDVKSLETMMAKDLGSDVSNFSCTIHDSWYLSAFFYAAGCTLYGPDGTDPDDCTWNNADGLEVGNYLIDLAKDPNYVEDKDGIAVSLMQDGKLGALCSGNWDYPTLHDALGDSLGACALPTIKLGGKDKQLSNFGDYKCVAVKSNTAYPMAAQLLAEYLTNEENQLIRYKEAGAAPCAISLADNSEIATNVSAAALIEQSEFATPQPSISQIANYWTPAASLGEGIVGGTITKANLQESLDQAVYQITSSLKK